MNYYCKASTITKTDATVSIKDSEISFGINSESAHNLPNPAELFLGSFSACILKNVERVSHFMKFEYSKAEISVSATRFEKPPRMDEIKYKLDIHSQDKNLNLDLLKKNIENFGTIFNTVKSSCKVTGDINQV
jgi:uncharacterized OsmC-like protein